MTSSRVLISCLPMAMLFAVLCAPPANAVPVVVNFDDLAAMPFWEVGQPVPVSAQLYNQMMPTEGILFTSGCGYVTVVDLGPDHTTSGLNGIAGANPDGTLTYARTSPLVIRFCDPGNPSVPAVTNFVSIRADLWGGGLPITLNAYDVHGNLVDSDTQNDLGGATLTVSGPGIHAVMFLGTSDVGGVACDDLTFNPTAVIPEPASLLLASLGLGLMSAARRFRRS
jgi:hypothetical protein